MRSGLSRNPGIVLTCTFCEIISGKLRSQVLYEDKDVIAILDKYPITVGHVLILPKRHIERFNDIPEEMYSPLFRAVKKVASMLNKRLGAEGYNIALNDGGVANQLIPHIHIHIIPRHRDDGVKFNKRMRTSGEDLEVIREKILEKK